MTDGADPVSKKKPQRQPDAARQAAARILFEVFEQGAYANLGSIQLLEQPDLRPLDRRFSSALVYGTISRLVTIDWILAQVSTRPVSQIDPWVRTILRMGVWQLYWSRSIPPMAAVDESVRLADKDPQARYAAGRKGDAGFVNAILRRLAASPIELPQKNLPVVTSLPPALFGHLRKWFGETEALSLAQSFLDDVGRVTARINRLRATVDEVRAMLDEQGIASNPGQYCPEAIHLDLQGQSIRSLRAWQDGFLSIQDEAAMLVAHIAAPIAGPDHLIIDVCAAPGGKTCHLAEWSGDQTPIMALDIHPARLKLVGEHAARLGIRSITTALADASGGEGASGTGEQELLGEAQALPGEEPSLLEEEPALLEEEPSLLGEDSFASLSGRAALVLADVPCSGLGLLGRKPEIKLHMTHEQMTGLYPLQAAILRRAGSLVQPGGTLIYSTCTINPAENIDQVESFIQASGGLFQLDPIAAYLPPQLLQDPDIQAQAAQGWLQLLPHRHHVDGFFIARMKRVIS